MVHIINKKVGVLEIEQQAYVDRYREREHEFALGFAAAAIHPGYQVKSQQGGEKDHKNEFGRPPGIKEDTADQDHSILIFPVYNKIHHHKDGEKVEKENNTAENHR